MANDEFLTIGVKVTNAEVLEKLEILKIERGISINSFIVQSIVEKLRKEGYLQNGVKQHIRKPIKQRERTTSFDMEWIMRNRK